jgi:hypothetical protein
MRNELLRVHQPNGREITPLGAWIFSRVLIATSALMFVPFVLYLWQS